MAETQLKNQTSVKLLAENERALVPSGIIRSDQEQRVSKNVYIYAMTILDKPEPIKHRRRKRKLPGVA